jgi:hypothetical protein
MLGSHKKGNKMLKKNIGTPGRILRLTFAVILLGTAWYYSSWILLAAGLFTLFEAFYGWCILYQFLGKNSCDIK